MGRLTVRYILGCRVATDHMADVDRRPGRHRGSPAWTAVRWTLLAAVLAGLFGMHVLTDGDNASGTAISHQSEQPRSPRPATTS